MLFVNVTVIDVRLRMTLDGKQMGIMGDGLFSHDTHSQINIDLVIYALFMNMHIDVRSYILHVQRPET